MRIFRISFLFFLLILAGCSSKDPSPNIILVFIDDLGYGDLGYTGATGYETPNIDRLAGDGLIFTHFYSAQAVCSASRAALLTGCYPNRIGITGALNHSANHGIHKEEKTIAELLKPLGYSTAIFGKWHLGHHQQFLPLQHGFDEYAGLPYSNDMWPVNYDGKPHTGRKAQYPKLPFIEGNETTRYIETLDDQDDLTSTYFEKSIDFIHRNSQNPFFLYLPHSMVHVPLGVSDAFRGKSEQGLFGDVMMELDDGIGRLIQALKEERILDNTLIIFTSDNGPWLNYGNHAGSTAGFREGKGTSWEGGQRVPAFVYWQGKILPGISNKMGATIDILPTLVSITGGALPENTIDGVDLSPVWFGDSTANPRDHLYFYYNRNDLEAVRKDHWKLVLPHNFRSYEGVVPGNDGWPGPYARGRTELALYDLRRDPGERYDVKDQYPEIVDQIMVLVNEAREELGDNLTETLGKGVRSPGWTGEGPVNRKLEKPHLAQGKKVNYTIRPSVQYSAGGEAALTDGILGSPLNLHAGWQGWHGTDAVFEIDLDSKTRINEVKISWLKNEGSWIFSPTMISYELFSGSELADVGEMIITNEKDQTGSETLEAVISIQDSIQSIRLNIEAVKTCPEGHPGAGEKAWLFIDEVIVR